MTSTAKELLVSCDSKLALSESVEILFTFDEKLRKQDIWRQDALSALRVRLKTSSRIAELSQHEADGGEFQEGKTAAVEIFPVLGETAAAVEPSNRTLDDPTLG